MLTISFFFFFNDTATTEIYTLSLHDALPILSARSASSTGSRRPLIARLWHGAVPAAKGDDYAAYLRRTGVTECRATPGNRDRKSTRLNSSHGYISYAVFCLKKKKTTKTPYNC